MKLSSFANVLMHIPDHWRDITHTLPNSSPPTLAAEGGVGALQFSVGIYEAGKLPCIDKQSLKHLLYNLEDKQGYERKMNVRDWENPFVFGITCDYQLIDGFVRVWYCSNGLDIALLTFFTDPIATPALNKELQEADEIARSLRFVDLK